MPHIRVPLRPSTNIADASYDASAKTLLVTFIRQGRQYRVHNITADVVEDFSHAPSAGIYYNTFIKNLYFIEEV